MTDHVEVRVGAYHDSVTLMLISRALTEDPAIEHATVAMGTALNRALLVEAGYELPEIGAGDLVVAFRTAPDNVDAVRVMVDRLLSERAKPIAGRVERPARTLRSAAAASDANVALISVPGEHAFHEAVEAIETGLHPVVFSDNVTVEHEVALKAMAADAGLVAMGPDCGTVILDGVGLGFANVVDPGRVGLVSASGTGAQQVCALVEGVRHVIGVGGRDLTDEVGGASAFAALRLLADDDAIESVGVIAKEIGPRTRAALDELVRDLPVEVVEISLDDITEGASALAGTRRLRPRPPDVAGGVGATAEREGRIVGLYSGGTLALEADRILEAYEVETVITDLGGDEFTRGRPHPMIDFRLRLQRLAEAGADPSVGAILLDCVLGNGAHADPASELGPAIAALSVPVFVALIATPDDPQGRDAQAERLAAAGATVFVSNAAAARASVGT